MKNKKLFGTDGIRGLVNQYPVDPITMVKIGYALGQSSEMVIIGKDTRDSCDMLEHALVSGLVAMGTNVILAGILPTPAIAMLTKMLHADFGIMISASHNHYQDNGIKLFNINGFKLSAHEEQTITKLLDNNIALPHRTTLGKVTNLHNATSHYSNSILNSLPNRVNLSGYKIIIDCANGAAYEVAPHIFEQSQAEVIVINDEPDGSNINHQCGVLFPETISSAVIEHKADLGIAFDGDADRVILCDEKGQIIDGEQILATLALHTKCKRLVANVMASISFERHLQKQGIKLFRSNVGDRHIMEYMLQNKCNLGGESSGHIILSKYNNTSDGIMAAMQIASIISEQHKTASALCHQFSPQPSILKNISIHNEVNLEDEVIQNYILHTQQALGENGRILIRRSGTEQVIRILVEGPDDLHINNIANEAIKIISNLT